MSENENQESTIAVNLCKNGCGFYGSTQFDGMCSVCHKEAVKKRQRHDEDQIQKPTASPHAAAALLCASASNSYGGKPLDPSGGADGKKGVHGGATSLPDSGSTSTESEMRAMQPPQQSASASATFAHPVETAGAAVDANTNEDSHGADVAAAVSAVPCSIAALSTNDGESLSSSLGTSSSTSTTDSYQQKKRIRCGMCKKKVGLTGFECRCGGVFCSAHRYSDKHSCSFDYQSHGQEQIRKANPQVLSSKIDKI